MKKIVVYVLAAVFSVCCSVSEARASRAGGYGYCAGKPAREFKEVVFSVNMHCGKCVEKITENISFEKGVKDLSVSLENLTVRIEYDASRTSEEKLAAALEKLGYEVKTVRPETKTE